MDRKCTSLLGTNYRRWNRAIRKISKYLNQKIFISTVLNFYKIMNNVAGAWDVMIC